MSKVFAIVLLVVSCLGLTSCGPAPSSGSPSPSPSPSPTPIVSPTPIASATPSYGGGGAKKTFITAVAYSPNMDASASAALTSADLLCNTASNKPAGGGTYKALLASSLRRACTSANCGTSGVSENSDWIFAASTTYTRDDGTTIGTTTMAAIFTFPLSASFDGGHDAVATGLGTDWTTSSDNCSDWTSDSGNYVVGYSGGTGASAINMSTNACGQNAKLICVEQ